MCLDELRLFILVGVTMTRKIDNETIKRLLELHESGVSSLDAGKIAGVSYQTALNEWRRHGFEPNFNRKRTPYSKIRSTREFIKEGHSIKEASSAFQLSEATVRRRIKDYEKAEPLLHRFESQLKELLRSKENTAKGLRVVPLPYDLKAQLIKHNNMHLEGTLKKTTPNIFEKREGRSAKEPHAVLLRGSSMLTLNSSQRPSKKPALNVPMHPRPGIIDISGFLPDRRYDYRHKAKAR